MLESLKAHAKTQAQETKGILHLRGIEHFRRWQTLQIRMLGIEQHSIDRYCLRSLRMKCAWNSCRPSCNGERAIKACRMTKLATPLKIEIGCWKDGLISPIGLSQSIINRQVTYIHVRQRLERSSALQPFIHTSVRSSADAGGPECKRYGRKRKIDAVRNQ